MKVLLLLVGWCLLLVLSWPVAVLAHVLAPLVWLVALPLRLLAAVGGGVFATVRALLAWPARRLGPKG